MQEKWFRNDTRSSGVGGLTFDNGVGSVTIHGSMTLVRDEISLRMLSALKERISELESALASDIEEGAVEGEDEVRPLETVANPFA